MTRRQSDAVPERVAGRPSQALARVGESVTAGEVAAVIGVKEGTARTRIRRAKQLLEAQLQVLAESDARFQSTISRLDDWARELRDQLGVRLEK